MVVFNPVSTQIRATINENTIADRFCFVDLLKGTTDLYALIRMRRRGEMLTSARGNQEEPKRQIACSQV